MLALRSSSTAAATVAAAGPTNQLAEPRHRNFHAVAAPGVARAIPRPPPGADHPPRRNARVAQLERGGRQRRGRRLNLLAHLVDAAVLVQVSPRGTAPAHLRGRRPARTTPPVPNACIAQSQFGGRKVAPAENRQTNRAHSVFSLAIARRPSIHDRNLRTPAGFPHTHRSPRFSRFPQPTPLWKTARGRRSCDVDASRRRSGPVDMWKTCVA